MATNNVVNSFKKITVEERAEMKEKFADVSTQIFVQLNFLISLVWYTYCTYVIGQKQTRSTS